MLPGEAGEPESMLMRVYRQIREVDGRAERRPTPGQHRHLLQRLKICLLHVRIHGTDHHCLFLRYPLLIPRLAYQDFLENPVRTER